MANNVCLEVCRIDPNNEAAWFQDNLFVDASNGTFNSLDGISTPQIFKSPIINSMFGGSPIIVNDSNIPDSYPRDWCGKNIFIGQMFGTGGVLVYGDTPISFEANECYFISSRVFVSEDNQSIPSSNFDFLQTESIKFQTNLQNATIENLIYWNSDSFTKNRWIDVCAKITTTTAEVGNIWLELSDNGSELNLVGDTIGVDYIHVGKEKFEKKLTTQKIDCQTFSVRESVDTRLTKRVRDYTKLTNFFDDFSKSVELIIDKNTKNYFGDLSNVASYKFNCLNDYKYCGTIKVNNQKAISGLLTFDGSTISKDGGESFASFVLSGEISVWKALMADYTLADMSWGEYNHKRNIDYVVDSWTNNPLMVYALFEERPDWGVDYEHPYNFINFPFEENQYWTRLHRMHPHLFLEPLLKKIFCFVGYNLKFEGEFLESEKWKSINVMLSRYYVPHPYHQDTHADGTAIGLDSTGGYMTDMREELCPYNLCELVQWVMNLFNIEPETIESEKCVIFRISDKKTNSKTVDFPLDCDQDCTLTKLSSQYGCIELKYKEDGNDKFFEAGQLSPDGSEFGNCKINLDSNSDETLTVETGFAATRRHLFTDEDYIPRADSESDADPLLHPKWCPRIFCYNGLQPMQSNSPFLIMVDGYQYVINQYDSNGTLISGEPYEFTSFPQNEFYTDTGDFSLTFHDYGENNSQGIKNRLYQQSIDLIKDKYLLRGNFHIPMKDLRRLTTKEEWRHGNKSWFINQIIDANPFEEESTTVELINCNNIK